MSESAIVIPEKIYFKIGEVCELLDVQAHVLRYWETEFPMLSPQKNKSGQRSYRRRDVEMALRIKQLLYNEMFTIAGARKKLQADARDGNRPKVASVEAPKEAVVKESAPRLFDVGNDNPVERTKLPSKATTFSGDHSEALRSLATNLLELREMLKPKVKHN